MTATHICLLLIAFLTFATLVISTVCAAKLSDDKKVTRDAKSTLSVMRTLRTNKIAAEMDDQSQVDFDFYHTE